MIKSLSRIAAAGAGIVGGLTACAVVHAEDIEIFVGSGDLVDSARPNVLLILDDSGSMQAETLTQSSYDPTVQYPGGSCNAAPDRVYWSTSGSPPSCNTSNYIERSAFQCQRALDAFAAMQGGTYLDYFAHYDAHSQHRWEELSSSYHTRTVECRSDLPHPASAWSGHGDGSNANAVYPRNGDPNQLWTADSGSAWRIAWGAWPTGQRYQVYSGNYLNWFNGAARLTSRLQVMQDVATSIVNSTHGINIGLMHFSGEEGGVVAHAIEDIESARSSLVSAIDDLSADNFTPLEETLYEAYLYLSGGTARFGHGGDGDAFADATGSVYDSPIDLSCQKSHVVLLTDGEPRLDQSASSAIVGLTDAQGRSFRDLVGGTCDVESYPEGFVTGEGGDCLDELAEFMHAGDMSSLPGVQNVTTHTVGFHVDLPILEQTAARGGGEYHTAVDTASLNTALANIVTSILDTQATFTPPSIAINAFNQTRHLNEIYVGVFSPSTTAHWPGNLKKLRLRGSDGTIIDANGAPAIDEATGEFLDSVQDLWSSTIDGAAVTAGGAAGVIPAARNIYTFFGDSDLTHESNAIDVNNPALTDGLLNTGSPGTPARAEIIDFINGHDASDIDQDGDLTEPRRQLGDPLHSPPVVVVYGPGDDDALVFMGTNDGYLHAFNAADGTEAWAFLPPEFIGDQVRLFSDNTSSAKTYGPDGRIRVQTIANDDGVIEPGDGERVLLFFGMRRGGDAYYALDVTDPDAPQVLWRKDSNDLPGMGQSWSSVTSARVDIAGASQNRHKLTLVIGGGYDASQDAMAASADSVGNSIYMVDMLSGDLLWHGASSGGDANFSTASWSMDYSIPGDVRVLDLDGDGFSERMYAADMGGQIWRFDIANGNTPDSLVTGGVIAQLGAAGLAAATAADTRRFYYAPDVVRVFTEESSYLHIGIGSGHRAHPSSTANQDAFFALRDYWTLTPKTQVEHNQFVPIRPADLVDVTTDLAASVPPGSPGWQLRLNEGGWRGEKVLAEARTFDGRIFISTYRPGTSGIACEPALGTTRQYIVDLIDASPVTNLDGSIDAADLQLTDRYREHAGLLPPETVFFFPEPEGDTDGDGDIDADDGKFTLACIADGNCLGETPCQGLRCFPGGAERFPVRTFWTQELDE